MEAVTDTEGQMLILAGASAKSIWEVIVSCEKAYVFVDGLQDCEVLEEHEGRALVHQRIDKGWMVPEQDFVFESVREPFEVIVFRLVEVEIGCRGHIIAAIEIASARGVGRVSEGRQITPVKQQMDGRWGAGEIEDVFAVGVDNPNGLKFGAIRQ